MDKFCVGLKSVKIEVYPFGGRSIVGALELHKRLTAPTATLLNQTFITEVKMKNDGKPPRVHVEFENGRVDVFDSPHMTTQDFIDEINLTKTEIKNNEMKEEFKDDEPDPMEEIVAQEMERRAKKLALEKKKAEEELRRMKKAK